MIHPDFVFLHSWEYQERLIDLQGDINESIEEIQVAVSSVLKSSTSQTLQQFESHISDVEGIYVPMLAAFQTLNPGNCRNDAEDVLNRTTTNTGYRASICAATYDIRVRTEVDAAANALSHFNGLNSQVQSIVVKAFVGQNKYANPEAIEDKITEIFDIVKGKWEGSKPEIHGIRENLASSISAQNGELVKCHEANLKTAATFYAMFEDMVQVCIDFDSIPNPFAASKRFSNAAPSPSFTQKHAEFLAAFENQQPYKWQA